MKTVLAAMLAVVALSVTAAAPADGPAVLLDTTLRTFTPATSDYVPPDFVAPPGATTEHDPYAGETSTLIWDLRGYNGDDAVCDLAGPEIEAPTQNVEPRGARRLGNALPPKAGLDGPPGREYDYSIRCHPQSDPSGEIASATAGFHIAARAPHRPKPPQNGTFDLECTYIGDSENPYPRPSDAFPPGPGGSFEMDPIKGFGRYPFGHKHDFYGFLGIEPGTTSETMRAKLLDELDKEVQDFERLTTCAEVDSVRDAGDQGAENMSALWFPTLQVEKGDDGRPDTWYDLPADHFHIYYRSGGNDGKTQAFPFGFKQITPTFQTEEEALDDASGNGLPRIAWYCDDGFGGPPNRVPNGCDRARSLHVALKFPSCWNGELVGTPEGDPSREGDEFTDNMAYLDVKCPPSHPTKLPRLFVTLRYDFLKDFGRRISLSGTGGDQFRLSSGPLWTFHGDYMFGWNPERMDFLTHFCGNTEIACRTKGERRP
jgi:hypothetical protein